MRLEQVRTQFAEGGYADTMTVDSLADFNGNVRSPIMHLKRGTTFIALLLDRFCTTDWSLRAAAKDAYVDTLGTYHGWTTRQGVKVALYALPSRDTFLETLAPGHPEDACAKLHQIFRLVWPRADSLNRFFAAREWDQLLVIETSPPPDHDPALFPSQT